MREIVRRMEEAGIRCWTNASGFHRTDGPAILYPDGREEWYRDGTRHREGGPAICGGAVSAWYQDGQRHRTDGPAYVTAGGREEWYQEGLLHRMDGPAICDPETGDEWYVRGEVASPFDDRILGADTASGTSIADTFF